MRIVIFGDANSINVQRWREGLVDAGADVYVLSTHIEQPRDSFTLPIMTPDLPLLPEKLRYFTAVPAARRLIAQIKPDLVIGYFVTGYGTVAALSGFQPLVQVTSGDDVLISPNHPLLRHLVRFNLHRASLVVAWAPHMEDAVRNLGVSSTKIMTLPRGIPLALFKDLTPPYPDDSRPLRLISTRSLYRVYHIDMLIRAVHILRQQGLDCTLTILGEGPERPTLEDLAHSLHLEEKVQFTGHISNNALPEVLARHSLYLSVIETDGVSASLLEAMAAGLFPIVYDNIANRYWIESGKNGLLIQANAPEVIARAVRQAANDSALRQRASQTNRELIFERGDLHRNTAKYLERFSELIEAYKTASFNDKQCV